jgi:tRNA(adenine34) deaminase
MIHARINRIIFGAPEPRAGALTSQLALLESGHFNHSMQWTGGILEDQCRALMKDFFKQRR